MKRFITLILCAVMLSSIIVMDTSAAGELVFSDNFNSGFAPRNWFNDASGGCKYTWDDVDLCLNAYGDAPVLQSKFTAPYNKKWSDFYNNVDIKVLADDEREELWPEFTFVRFWYRDMFDTTEAGGPAGALYYYSICVQTGEATVSKEITYSYQDESGMTRENTINTIIAGPVSINDTIEVGENAKWFNMGMRVTDGVMQCYYNEKLIIELRASEDDEKVGGVAVSNIDATVGTEPSPFIFFNHGNWIKMDNFEVWTADYDFSTALIYGDADNSGTVNLLDASAMMKHAAGWFSVVINEEAADVDCSGKVNLVDVGLVMKSIAKWDINLGPAK